MLGHRIDSHRKNLRLRQAGFETGVHVPTPTKPAGRRFQCVPVEPFNGTSSLVCVCVREGGRERESERVSLYFTFNPMSDGYT